MTGFSGHLDVQEPTLMSILCSERVEVEGHKHGPSAVFVSTRGPGGGGGKQGKARAAWPLKLQEVEALVFTERDPATVSAL